MQRPITEDDMLDFVAKCQAITDSERCDSKYVLGFEKLQKNYRVFREYETADGKRHGKSLYCFVEIATGDVYKGSWKAVVKNGKRGNVFEADISRFMDWSGTRYLR